MNESTKKLLVQRVGQKKLIPQLKAQIVAENILILKNEVQNLEKFRLILISITDKIKDILKNQYQIADKLQKQIAILQIEIEEHKKKVKAQSVGESKFTQMKNIQKQYIEICRNRIQTAQNIEIKKLAAVRIENRNSIANQVFKWILTVVYCQPESKFYWPNFKEQVFQQDKGKDFIERLGKSDTMKQGTEEKAKTDQLLSHFDRIIASEELKKCTSEINKIQQIIVYYQRCCELARKMQQMEHQYEQYNKKSKQAEEQFHSCDNRIKALEGRLRVNKMATDELKQIQSQLSPKLHLYTTTIVKGNEFIAQFQGLQTSIPSISYLTEQKLNCDCTIL